METAIRRTQRDYTLALELAVVAQIGKGEGADLTDLPTAGQFVDLSRVTDAQSRKIVGSRVHESLHTEEVAQAAKMALRSRRPDQRLVHHDRGVGYCSTNHQALRQRHGMTCSMTDGYDCDQNDPAARVKRHPREGAALRRPTDLQWARRVVGESAHIHDHERPHRSLDLQTPDAVHRTSMPAWTPAIPTVQCVDVIQARQSGATGQPARLACSVHSRARSAAPSVPPTLLSCCRAFPF